VVYNQPVEVDEGIAMPIIRDEPIRLPREAHERLSDELRKAITDPSPGEPVIFEIPFTGTLYDVMVVWGLWEGVQPDERTAIISEAYRDSGVRVEIAQAMGVTHDEALQDRLLPYAVTPCTHEGEVEPSVLRQAMLEEGAIALTEDRVDLRFPTMRMAESAHHRLCEKVPKGYWAIAVTTDY
jgi:hypothetical protein